MCIFLGSVHAYHIIYCAFPQHRSKPLVLSCVRSKIPKQTIDVSELSLTDVNRYMDLMCFRSMGHTCSK